MKKILLPLTAFVSGIVFTAMLSWENNNEKNTTWHTSFDNPNPGNRLIIALRKIKLKDGVFEDAFEKFATKIAHDEYGKLPGVSFYCGKGERGDEPGTYINFMDFDSKSTRDFYYR